MPTAEPSPSSVSISSVLLIVLQGMVSICSALLFIVSACVFSASLCSGWHEGGGAEIICPLPGMADIAQYGYEFMMISSFMLMLPVMFISAFGIGLSIFWFCQPRNTFTISMFVLCVLALLGLGSF